MYCDLWKQEEIRVSLQIQLQHATSEGRRETLEILIEESEIIEEHFKVLQCEKNLDVKVRREQAREAKKAYEMVH